MNECEKDVHIQSVQAHQSHQSISQVSLYIALAEVDIRA
jgi:hypothetical protein